VWALWIVLAAGPPLLIAWRIHKAGLRIGSDEIVVRGPLKTWAVPLAGAKGFSPGVQSGYGPNGTPCPTLSRDGGWPVGIWALGREGVIWRYGRYLKEYEPLCAELNGLLRRLQTEAGVARPPAIGPLAGPPVASPA
jgi:hypothetical protein